MRIEKLILLLAALPIFGGCTSSTETNSSYTPSTPVVPTEPVDTTEYPESISITELEKSYLVVNDTVTLSWKVLPENAENKSVLFSSDNEEVLTVSNSGEVKAVGKGIAKITITSVAKSSVESSITIEVKKPSAPIVG